MPGVFRVRKGTYRILYRIDDDRSEVWIEDVRQEQGIRRLLTAARDAVAGGSPRRGLARGRPGDVAATLRV
jgi:hypothetical protein